MQTISSLDIALLERARDLAVRLAEEAGVIQREAIQNGSAVHFKGEIDLVTDADIASEKLISSGILAEFPDHRLTGEEGAIGAESGDYRWLIDPIDGTTNFAHKQPHWAVSICLEYAGEPVMGVVYDVAKREMFTAIAGQGAFLNGVPIHVSAETQLKRALGSTGFSYDVHARAEAFALWEAFSWHAQAMRRDGAAALDMVWVACGRLDFYFEKPINNWDVSAGAIICREAGATVTRLDGEPYNINDEQIAASNGALHQQMVDLIRQTLHQ
ncbi:MAG: inositol monophosphatase [Thermomicrobiales bacterium]|nr:inositol monophosphatase [Thermomicrobiales bacterium]